MKRRNYIKPAVRTRHFRVPLLNTVSAPDISWGAKKQGCVFFNDFQESVDEIDKMFE